MKLARLLLPLLLACPALGQGLILGAPAQGNASGGGGGSGDLTEITVTGTGLTLTSGTGPVPDLELAAVLQALSDLSGADNQLVRMDGTGDLQASDATLSDGEQLNLTSAGSLLLGDVLLSRQAASILEVADSAGTGAGQLRSRGPTSVHANFNPAVADTAFFGYRDDVVTANLSAFSATSTTAPRIDIVRGRGTASAPALVQNGDILGTLLFRAADSGTAMADAAMIRCFVDGTAGGSGDMPTRMGFWTSPDGGGGLVERWRITSAGHFLSGTDNAWDIGASGATRPRTIYAGTSFLGPAGSASAVPFGVGAANYGPFQVSSSLGFAVNGTEEMRLTSSAVLLGTSHITLSSTALGSETVGFICQSSGVARVSDADTGLGKLCQSFVIEANATSNTISANESFAYVFTDDGTDNGNTSNNTLPAAAAGLVVRVYCAQGDANDILQVTAGTGDTIRIYDAATSAAGNVTTITTGSALVLVAIDATQWVCVSRVGEWIVSP